MYHPPVEKTTATCWTRKHTVKIVKAWQTPVKYGCIIGLAFFGILLILAVLPEPRQTCLMPSTVPTKPQPPNDHLETCTARDNIMYLKVPKCASSSIQNMLMRYGEARNLTFVLPRKGVSLGYPKPFRLRYALPLPSQYSDQYNILTHHVTWDDHLVPTIMPHDTVYIASLREPVAEFASAYSALQWETLRYGVDLETFIMNPQEYIRRSGISSQARNPIMSTFGFHERDFGNVSKIHERLQYIERKFDLVLMSDYLTESLVLLRKVLCWNWEDMVVFLVNARKPALRAKRVSDRTRNAILAWNQADVMLYDYFLHRFNIRKAAYGTERLERDVQHLRDLTAQWYNFCVRNAKYSRLDKPWLPAGTAPPIARDWEMGFAMQTQNSTCAKLAMYGDYYTQRLREKLWPNF